MQSSKKPNKKHNKNNNITLIALLVSTICVLPAGCGRSKFQTLGKSATQEQNSEAIAGPDSPETPKAPTLGLLTVAAGEGRLEDVRKLLRQGANIDENIGTNTDQITPLLAALAAGEKRVAEFLIRNGARLDARFKKHDVRSFLFLNSETDLQSLVDALSQPQSE